MFFTDDPFIEAAKKMLTRGNNDPDAYKKAGHDKSFIPAKVVKEKVKASYPHMQEI